MPHGISLWTTFSFAEIVPFFAYNKDTNVITKVECEQILSKEKHWLFYWWTEKEQEIIAKMQSISACCSSI